MPKTNHHEEHTMKKLHNYEIERLAKEELLDSLLKDFDHSQKPDEISTAPAITAPPSRARTVEEDSVVAFPGGDKATHAETILAARKPEASTSHESSQSTLQSVGMESLETVPSLPSNMHVVAAANDTGLAPVGPTGPAGPADPASPGDYTGPELAGNGQSCHDVESLAPGDLGEHAVGASSAATHATRGDVLPASSSSSLDDLPDGYVRLSDGIYELADGDSADPVYVCSPIRIVARFTDAEEKGHGRLFSVRSNGETWHDVPIYNSDFQRRPGEVIGTLLDHGLELAPDKRAKDRLLTFLKLSKPENRLQTVTRMGWVDDAYDGFVLGRALIGRQDVLPTSIHSVTGLEQAGNIDAWKQEVGAKCSGNPLMLLATSLAFSGPLLAPLGMTSGGFHFRGASSSGKTTLLRVAASIWGSPRLISSWCGTRNGLEAVAGSMNDILLPLDEIAEIAPRDLYGAIYMLGNGAGKTRMTKDAALADQAAWRLALISSGEISVRDKLKEARLETMAGHEVRLIDVEADSHAYGAFDMLHGAQSAAVFADGLQKSAIKHHGAVGREFIRLLIAGGSASQGYNLERIVQSECSKLLSKLPVILDGQVARVAKRFVVVGIAGELATTLGLTGWRPREALNAAEQGFLDWHDRRYSIRREAADDYIKSLQVFIAANSNKMPSIGASLVAKGDPDPVGWKDKTRVYLPTETWSQLFPGTAGTSAAKAMLDLNLLVPGEEAGRYMRKGPRALPGRKRVYTLTTDRLMSYRPE